MNQSVYRAALVGCGKIGAYVERYAPAIQPWAHASLYQENERTELVGFVDTDVSKRETLAKDFPGVPFFQNLRQMMEETKPDIVSVATLPESHAEIVETVASYPVKAILCEKPVAHTLQDAEKLVAICRERNIPLFINHMRRFDPGIRNAKRELQGLGSVMQAHTYYTRGIHNNGTHIIDLYRFMLGDVQEVMGVRNVGTETYKDLSQDMNIDGILTFESGARAVMQSIDSEAYGICDMEFLARDGKLVLENTGFTTKVFRIRPERTFADFKELAYDTPKISGGVRSFMRPVVEHIIDCLEGRDESVSTGEDGLAALYIIAALEESVRLGKAVPVGSSKH